MRIDLEPWEAYAILTLLLSPTKIDKPKSWSETKKWFTGMEKMTKDTEEEEEVK